MIWQPTYRRVIDILHELLANVFDDYLIASDWVCNSLAFATVFRLILMLCDTLLLRCLLVRMVDFVITLGLVLIKTRDELVDVGNSISAAPRLS